jgi:selenide,water dikinase
MGGRPITALSIIGFPIREVPDDVMHQILRGGLDKMAEAGVPVIGGHSINEKEIKAGFAVTGLINPDKIVTNAGAQPGDRLILTKPIGTGIVAFAAQIDRAPADGVEAAARWMATLNKAGSERMAELDANACTDVTGFGLMGHLAAMAAASKVDVEITWDAIPVLPGIIECLAEGIVPGATERNRESSGSRVVAGENVEAAMLDLCFDAQTSGGLLISVPESRADELLARVRQDGMTEAAAIGRVRGTGSGRVFVRTEGRRRIPARRKTVPAPAAVPGPGQPASACCEPEEVNQMSCCEDDHPSPDDVATVTGGTTEVEAKFHEFLKSANAPGALDGRTKRAIAIALSVLAKCEPCVKSHIKKAREEGFSQNEIDEAAWLAISFGGSPTMMFYKGVRRS